MVQLSNLENITNWTARNFKVSTMDYYVSTVNYKMLNVHSLAYFSKKKK